MYIVGICLKEAPTLDIGMVSMPGMKWKFSKIMLYISIKNNYLIK